MKRGPIPPTSPVHALAARRVLSDLRQAARELKAAANESDDAALRLRWVASVTLLRVVGHVLRNIDARRSRHMRAAVGEAWTRWKPDPLWQGFIEAERNMLLKEYRFAYHDPKAPEEAVLLLIGDTAFTPIEAVHAAERWWWAELGRLEDRAATLRFSDESPARRPQPSRRARSKKAGHLAGEGKPTGPLGTLDPPQKVPD